MTLPPLQSATINGRQLCWREKGTGAALVLIHGIGGNSESWAPQLEEFSSRYRVIAWDAPGYGGSTALAQPAPTADDFAREFAALLDMQGVLVAHVAGQSIGAVLAAALCRLIPATAQTLTLLHPLIGFGSMTAEERAQAKAARVAPFEKQTMAEFARQRAPAILGPDASPALLERVIRISGAAPVPAYRQLVEVMASSDMMAWASSLRLPTLVIAGEADKVAPPESCRRLAEALPDSVYECYQGIGHYMQLEDPQRLGAALERFLNAHEGVARAVSY